MTMTSLSSSSLSLYSQQQQQQHATSWVDAYTTFEDSTYILCVTSDSVRLATGSLSDNVTLIIVSLSLSSKEEDSEPDDDDDDDDDDDRQRDREPNLVDDNNNIIDDDDNNTLLLVNVMYNPGCAVDMMEQLIHAMVATSSLGRFPFREECLKIIALLCRLETTYVTFAPPGTKSQHICDIALRVMELPTVPMRVHELHIVETFNLAASRSVLLLASQRLAARRRRYISSRNRSRNRS